VSGSGALDVGPREKAALAVLVEQHGRVFDRSTLRRDAGLDHRTSRRSESVAFGVRRALGPKAIVTARRRGWRLSPDAVVVAAATISGCY
jgi:DNA-binding winged helix-turn-helix (wHTH) protein